MQEAAVIMCIFDLIPFAAWTPRLLSAIVMLNCSTIHLPCAVWGVAITTLEDCHLLHRSNRNLIFSRGSLQLQLHLFSKTILHEFLHGDAHGVFLEDPVAFECSFNLLMRERHTAQSTVEVREAHARARPSCVQLRLKAVCAESVATRQMQNMTLAFQTNAALRHLLQPWHVFKVISHEILMHTAHGGLCRAETRRD
jgi:hypothetical protein